LKRAAIFVHRWMGIAFCLLFAWWFLTGMFMMYWSYPAISDADRLSRAQPLEAARIRISPQEAFARLDAGEAARTVQLVMFDGRPVYRFGFGRSDQRMARADDGVEITEFPPALLQRIAIAWTGRGSPRFDGILTAEDQWTVSGAFSELRPLWKYAWPDGEEVYVSEVTGAVEQYTTRGSRLGAYLGAIPHWLYFTPLRENGLLWSRVVIAASALATMAALFGLVVGVWMYAPARGVPYKGPKRLHMILGLFFGVVACTWAFSGMLSMDPFPIEGDGGPYVSRIAAALRGKRPPLDAFASRSPREALAEVPTLQVKALEFTSFAGKPVYLATESPQRSRIIPARGASAGGFDWTRIAQVAAGAAPVSESVLLSEYDAYYLDRHNELPLPVVRLKLSDPSHSLYYIDPRTARIVGGYSSDTWISRWVYHGLHSLNFPWLYRYRPAWDIVVLALLGGGAALSITAMILAWRFLRRKLRLAEPE
jgi:hypothetical protein